MKDWEKKEELVKILEKIISPKSKVQRNVFLPNLNSPSGAKCQCDVVIYNGKPPRETISIVEVQKRGSKVDINTFRGWCLKMRDVGAQHLICVSEKGFPKSIEERALQMGPTVRLLTLAQIKDAKNWPFNFLSNTIKNPRRALLKIVNAGLQYENENNIEPENIEVHLEKKDFKYNGFLMSAHDIFFAHLDYMEGKGNRYEDGKHLIEMKLPLSKDEMLYKVNGEFKRVMKFTVDYEVDILNRESEITMLEYHQIDFGSSVAWVLESDIYIKDKKRELKSIFIPDENGFYNLEMRII